MMVFAISFSNYLVAIFPYFFILLSLFYACLLLLRMSRTIDMNYRQTRGRDSSINQMLLHQLMSFANRLDASSNVLMLWSMLSIFPSRTYRSALAACSTYWLEIYV